MNSGTTPTGSQPFRILGGDVHLTEVRTRIPARYGIAVVTMCPHAFVRVHVEIHGRLHTGIAADLLPPRWFRKNAEQSLADEIREMLRVVEQALTLATNLRGRDPFDLWWQLYHAQHEWGHREKLPPLLSNFGVTLVERALLEATCKAWETTLPEALASGQLRIPLELVYPELRQCRAQDLLPRRPLEKVTVRQTVGIGMALTDDGIAPAERLADELPQSLAALVDTYGLRHFKFKLSGEVEADRRGLLQLSAILVQRPGPDYGISMDGNEHFSSLGEFREYWETLSRQSVLTPLLDCLLFVEQPLERDVALDGTARSQLNDWPTRPPMIIDESDAELTSLRRALDCGYAGTSHKNCKGVFKSVMNACYLRFRMQEDSSKALVLSGEDMGNIGPVALLQDLAVAASLGIESVERNGHHYFAGLSMFPQHVQEQMLAAHPDLYARSALGWPTLTIRAGRLDLGTVNRAPLGVGFDVDVEQFTSSSDYRRALDGVA